MTDAARVVAEAQRAFAGGDAAGAVRLLDGLAGRAAPDPAGVLHLRALALRKMGRPEEARADFEVALRLAPDDVQIVNNYANLLKQQGEHEAALKLYDRAIEVRPDYRDARFNKALVLQSLGRLADAVALLEALCAADSRDSHAQSALGAVLLALDRLDEAGAAFDRALTLNPQLRTALCGRARIALGRGEVGAPAYFRRARQVAPADLDLLAGEAEALEAQGSSDALALLASAVTRRPDWIAGHELLARMRAEAGDADFAGHYKSSLAAAPERALRLSLARVLGSAERYGEALEALAGLADDPDLIVARAFLTSEAGDPGAALALLDRAGGPARADMDITRGRIALRAGEPRVAVIALERAVALDPAAIGAWAHLDLAWRLTGNARADWLSGQPGLVAACQLDLTDAELADTAALLRTLHRTRSHPIGQSLRGGTQTRGRLFARQEPEVRRLHAALDGAIEDYRDALPPADAGHPLLRHRDRPMRIAGSWSVRLSAQGFHVNHIHPEGVLSSACYASLPAAIGSGEGRDGWLELGRPPRELGLALEPLASIEPKPGRLALFPSYLFHGTRPFADGERLTVAFDVVAG